MKLSWLLVLSLLVLLVITETEAAKKKKKKIKKIKKKKNNGMKKNTKEEKECAHLTVNTKQFRKWTETYREGKNVKPVTESECWWDLSRNDCATCKNGGNQCGWPMHNWCQNPKIKGGCNGISSNKYTLSSKGYPCYSNTKDTSCAWCAPGKVGQCKMNQRAENCGSYCHRSSNKPCDGLPTNCKKIAKCGLSASCSKKEECVCDKGFYGNGFQCFNSSTGEAALNPESQVEVDMTFRSEFFVYPHQSGQFPMDVKMAKQATEF